MVGPLTHSAQPLFVQSKISGYNRKTLMIIQSNLSKMKNKFSKLTYKETIKNKKKKENLERRHIEYLGLRGLK